MSIKKLQKVEGYENLRRDSLSRALVNTNKSDYRMAKEAAAKKKLAREKLENLSLEVSELKNEMSEIKDLLKNLTTHLIKGE